MTLRRIVAGVSPAQPRDEVVAWAAREASARRAVLELVTAYRDRAGGEPPPTPDGLRWAAAVAAEGRPGLVVTNRAVSGGPEQVLCAAATGAELLVVGADAQSPFREAIVGSVPGALLTTATCPMVVVPHGADFHPGADAPVLVGVDTAESSREALDHGFATASRDGRDMHVVLCWTTPRDHAERCAERTEQQRALAVALAGFAEQYPDVAVTQLLVDNDPIEELTRRSRRAALLVLGSRGRARLASMAFGSVSRTLIRHRRCPVAVVRPDLPAAAGIRQLAKETTT